jgi:hypothetical protein
MRKPKVKFANIPSFDIERVLETDRVDGRLAYLVLAYLRSRTQESYTFKAKSVVMYIKESGDPKFRATPPTSRKVANVLDFLASKGVVSLEQDETYPKRYRGSRNRVDEFIKNMNEAD